MIFGRNKRKLHQDAIFLGKDQINITHENKYLGIDTIITLSHPIKGNESQVWKPQ